MVKRATKEEKAVGTIQLAEQKLSEIKEKLDENIANYNGIWKDRTHCLVTGDVVHAAELEKQYYYLRDVVEVKLDQERIQAIEHVNFLRSEVERIKAKIINDTIVLDRQNNDLEQLKSEHAHQITNKERGITNTIVILEDLNTQLVQLEGEL